MKWANRWMLSLGILMALGLTQGCEVSPPICGDGIVDVDAGEECDTVDNLPGSGCDPACFLEEDEGAGLGAWRSTDETDDPPIEPADETDDPPIKK